MWPPPEDHADDVVCGVGMSMPCRMVFWIVKQFDLPVDICGIDFAKDLNSPACLEVNPIHSLPFMVAYGKDGSKTGINGSEAILDYLCSKYRDKVPDSFYPADPLAKAKVMEKFNHIQSTCYRATMYQYVYPLMGLMTECQYDLCKRDFALGIVEDWAKGSPGTFLTGENPTVADFVLASLFCGNNWVQDEAFKGLPWRHCDVIDQYPASKKAIDAVLALKGVAEINDLNLEGAPGCNLWNTVIAKDALGKELNKGRNFAVVGAEGGPMLHPNAVPYVPGMKEYYDKPLK